jgi:DNA-binding NarL/FixJ family response regulator
MTNTLWATLPYVLAGLTSPQIAEEMGIASSTAKERVKLLMRVYEARNRTALVSTVLREARAERERDWTESQRRERRWLRLT